MATAPADKGLGLSQSHSNSALDYSGDTFESFSEEESQAPGSCCSSEDLEGTAVSEALESSSSVAGQSPAEEESEAVDAAAAIGRWIDAVGKGIDVKNKHPGTGPGKSATTAPAEPCMVGAPAEFGVVSVPGLSPEELAALGAFCSRGIRRVQQRDREGTGDTAGLGDTGDTAAGHGDTAAGLGDTAAGHGDTGDTAHRPVPARLVSRILLGSARQAARQVTEAEIHETSTCPECQQKEAELARAAFLRHKKILLEGALIQEKLEKQLYSRDMLTLLGEALRSFPKPSEDPRDLWQRMKGQGMENQNQT